MKVGLNTRTRKPDRTRRAMILRVYFVADAFGLLLVSARNERLAGKAVCIMMN